MKSIAEINAKIARDDVVVLTAAEMKSVVAEEGAKKAAERVDVVTTATFGPMCSSGLLINTGHTKPRMRFERATLNRVPAYCGLAAVDVYLGATELPDDDPRNRVHPGRFRYGGAHVIEALLKGEEVLFEAEAYGTDCYPRRRIRAVLTLERLNSALLINPRNCYQNYVCAVNKDPQRTLYTYMGILRPNLGNASYATCGPISPLFCDPYLRCVGVGTRILVAGAPGFVFWWGTQTVAVERNRYGIPRGGAATLATVADLKKADPAYLRAVSITGYGVSLALGIAVPIPVLDAEIAAQCAVTADQIEIPIVDYSHDYPNLTGRVLGYATYAQLRSGTIEIDGKPVETACTSSMRKALELAEDLKERIKRGAFFLTEAVERFPRDEERPPFNSLQETQ